MICRGIYLGEVTFNEGAPEATKYLEAKMRTLFHTISLKR